MYGKEDTRYRDLLYVERTEKKRRSVGLSVRLCGMMKKLIALVIAMALICCAASSPAETETPAAKTVHQIEQKMISSCRRV